ncbi:hypothetical protein LR48_Vigan04g115800 [Vigna angularis]|uniref:Uncharacterized protein n=1 Tax=Phaseolus angularis TaxID=3914 RepID=A0A0L9UDI4_PHAAN|nr:hypothetical protein LR48_Vigan04g115800 [Vigna angularis]
MQDELVEQQTQGTFVGQGREDLLVAVTGRLALSGRVRVVGGATGLRDYFDPKPRSTETMSQEALSSLREQMQLEMEERMNECFRQQEATYQKLLEEKHQMMSQQQQQQEEVPTDDPIAPLVSTKGSCSTTDPTDYTCQYKFLVDEDPPRVLVVRRQIARGRTLHGAPLLPTHTRVTIDEFYHPEKQPMAQPVNKAHEEVEDDNDPLSILMKILHKLNKGSVELE